MVGEMVKKHIAWIGWGLDRIGAWATGIAVLGAAMTWLWHEVSWFGPLPWPEAILLGIGASLVVALVLSACLVAWRVFRPIELQTGNEVDSKQQSSQEIEEELKLYREYNAKNVKAWTDLEGRIGLLEAVPQQTIGLMADTRNELSQRIEAAQASIHSIKHRQTEFESMVVSALRARSAMTTLKTIMGKIEPLAKRLLLADQGVYSSAEQWSDDYSRWQGLINECFMVIAPWSNEIPNPMKIDPHEFEVDIRLPENSIFFVDGIIVQKYKTLSVAHKKYLSVRGAAISRLDEKSFV
jgi:hypothetical protein